MDNIFQDNNLLIILGPTACGKTSLAAHLAKEINSEIISGDSRQVYKQMDLGTGKDLTEYVVNGEKIEHYLIDIVEPGYRYNIFEYQDDFVSAYHTVQAKKKIPILCGGSGMYIESVIKDYQMKPIPPNDDFRKEYEQKDLNELNKIAREWGVDHKILDPFNKKRIIRTLEVHQFGWETDPTKTGLPNFSNLIIGLNIDVELRREKITARLHERLDQGMIDEVKHLRDIGVSQEALYFYGLEYRFITNYLNGEIKYNKMVESLNIAIHQFAKRQMTWFRRMEKNGFKIDWINGLLSMDDKLNISMELFHHNINADR